MPAADIRKVGQEETHEEQFEEDFSKDSHASAPHATTSAGHHKFAVGDTVEARFNGGADWYSGKIVDVRPSGSYDILYDDGDDEQSVPPNEVRAKLTQAQTGNNAAGSVATESDV